MEHKRENGHIDLPRFRMEQAVDPASLAEVTEYLPGLSKGLVIIHPDYYHNTIVSLARAGTVFSHLRMVVPNLAQEHYATELATLLRRLSLIESGIMRVPGERFDVYGNGQRVFVLKLRLTPELRELHDEAYEEVSRMLKRCGATHPRRVMEGVYGLHYSIPERFKPHISLARNAGKKKPALEARDLTAVLYPAQVMESQSGRGSYHGHPDYD